MLLRATAAPLATRFFRIWLRSRLSRNALKISMSKIEEIEQAVEKLPLTDFVKLAVWVDQRREQLEIAPQVGANREAPVRDHSAFLNSYSPQDEGLYDDAAAR